MNKNITDFFVENTKYTKEDLKSYDAISGGSSSNINYLITLKKGEKFQVKLSEKKLTPFKSYYGYEIYKNNLVVYKDSNGNMIKKWLPGNTLKKYNDKTLNRVMEEIKLFHSLEYDSNKTNFFAINAYRKTTKLDKKILDEFDKTSKELEQTPVSFIHGDINFGNILVNNDNVTLIDLEWSMEGYEIIDYASLVAFCNAPLNKVANFSGYEKELLYRISRFVLIHSLMWCEEVNTHKAHKLANFINKRLISMTYNF